MSGGVSCLFVVCFALKWWQLKEKKRKKNSPPILYLIYPLLLHKKREIYRYIKVGVSDYLQYGGCAFHYFCMVLWRFSIPNMDRWSLSGETYAKIGVFQHPFRNQSYPVKSRKKKKTPKTINSQVMTWISSHSFRGLATGAFQLKCFSEPCQIACLFSLFLNVARGVSFKASSFI